ncbi:MAG TPA: DNA polymerase III subunit beta [Myxococcota bacterium]|nr:DNA polymerase III subunit beta [Myxococcota bacterium]HRY92223.1 DNA polymerase III subunit beta [Myxococcota bacterium]
MKVAQRPLYEALKELTRVVPIKHALTVLTMVLIEVRNGLATLTSTDLETRLTYRLPAEGELTTCLPVKLLRDLVKPESAKQNGEVVIEPMSDKQVRVEVAGAESRVACYVPLDFPDWPVAPGDFKPNVVWDGDLLRRSLDFVLPAVSHDKTRPHLGGVYFDSGRAVATDGHRLHWHALEPKLPKSLLLPGAAASILAQLACDGPVNLSRAEGWSRFEGGNWVLMSKEMDGTYPHYTQVVPGANEATSVILLPSAPIRRELQRLKRLAPKANVKVTLNGALSLSIQDHDANQATAVIKPTENSHTGKDLVIGVNPAYLVEALGTADETVRVGFGDAIDPVRIDLPGGRLSIVMPVRL